LAGADGEEGDGGDADQELVDAVLKESLDEVILHLSLS
jgi:hypothetical protein